MRFTSDFQREIKRLSNKGRCLHFDSGNRCDQIISAHTIQKSRQLKNIAEDGKVYRFSGDLSILNRTNGIPESKIICINKASTFPGFCKRHDNDLFRPIDQDPLLTHPLQVGLYAYRSLCREFFLKENAIGLWTTLVDHPELSDRNRSLVAASLAGNKLGFNRLLFHKQKFEASIQSGSFQDFQHTTFSSKMPFPIQVSGVYCPDFDFFGAPLQNLANPTSPLDCLAFFTAPSIDGWSLCFAWHNSSDRACSALLRSLATIVHEGHSLDTALLRFVFSCSENHAFRISWWDNLPLSHKASIINAAALMTNPYQPLPSTYLLNGFESIQAWHFDSVRFTSPGNA